MTGDVFDLLLKITPLIASFIITFAIVKTKVARIEIDVKAIEGNYEKQRAEDRLRFTSEIQAVKLSMKENLVSIKEDLRNEFTFYNKNVNDLKSDVKEVTKIMHRLDKTIEGISVKIKNDG